MSKHVFKCPLAGDRHKQAMSDASQLAAFLLHSS